MKIVGVVQARMQSTRLPGKVLLPVAGRPMLEGMLIRLQRAVQLDELVVATTVAASDRAILELASTLGVRCVAGHPTDLVSRHALAAAVTDAEAVVKIPSDCPLVDPQIVDEVVAAFRREAGHCDYLSNLHPATWPDGNDVEVFTREILEIALREADRPHEREHTTPFFWDQPSRFRILNVAWGSGRNLSSTHRLTVDHQEDLEVVAAVCGALDRDGRGLSSVDEIVEFLDRNPSIREHNARYRNTGWPTDHEHLLRTGLRPIPRGRLDMRT